MKFGENDLLQLTWFHHAKMNSKIEGFLANFLISQDIHVTKTDSRTKIKGENDASSDTNYFIPVKASQFHMQTLERSFTDRVHRQIKQQFCYSREQSTRRKLAALIGEHALISIRQQYEDKIRV